VTVVVVDAATNAALPSSIVTCMSDMDTLGPISTGASNSFTWEGQYRGRWTCRADHDGYNPNSNTVFISTPQTCVATSQIVVPLKYRSACIFGLVYDDFTGAPIPNATVTCTSGQHILPIRVTDTNGKWFHEQVVAGTWRGAATAPGYLPGATTQTYTFDEKKTHKIPLQRIPGRVVGIVIDSKNSTALYAQITCTDIEGKMYSLTNAWNFSYNPMRAGVFSCQAWKEGFQMGFASGMVPSSGVLNLTIPLVEWYGNLKGQIIDGRTGVPISNARVHCESICSDQGYDLTSIQGLYFIGGLKKGPYMCMVTHLGYMDGWDSQIVYVNETSTLNFVLLPIETVVYGKIYQFDIVPGAPIAGASIDCVGKDKFGEQKIHNVSDAQGNFRIGEFYGSGEMTCVVSANGFETSSRFLRYRWEEKIECDISLPRTVN